MRDEVVLPETRAAIKAALPNFDASPELASLMGYLLLSAAYDENGLLLGNEMLSRLLGRSVRNGVVALQSLATQLGVGLEVKSFHSSLRRSRVVVPRWPAGVEAALEVELAAHFLDRRARGVSLVSGAPGVFSASAASRARSALRLACKPDDRHPVPELIELLNAQPVRTFNALLQRNWAAAMSVAEGLPARSRRYNQLLLRRVADQALPLYGATQRLRSVRVFGVNEALLLLSKEVRQALCGGCVEFDLRSAQLAINVRDWGVQGAEAILLRSESVWSQFASFVDVDEMLFKPTFKQLVYALCFGSSVGNLKRFARNGCVEEGCLGLGDAGVRLFEHPLLQKLLAARSKRLRMVEAAGGAVDCFERWVPVDEKGAKGVLASLAQARELSLMLPAFEVIAPGWERRKDVVVVAFQHDGLTLSLSDASKATSVVRQVRDAVNRRCFELGYPTFLEEVVLPMNSWVSAA